MNGAGNINRTNTFSNPEASHNSSSNLSNHSSVANNNSNLFTHHNATVRNLSAADVPSSSVISTVTTGANNNNDILLLLHQGLFSHAQENGYIVRLFIPNKHLKISESYINLAIINNPDDKEKNQPQKIDEAYQNEREQS